MGAFILQLDQKTRENVAAAKQAVVEHEREMSRGRAIWWKEDPIDEKGRALR